DAAILRRMVEIDVQVAVGFEDNVDQRVPRQLLQHVVEETDAGHNVIGARAVEIDAGFDFRLAGGALDAGLPFHCYIALLASPRPRLYQLGNPISIGPGGSQPNRMIHALDLRAVDADIGLWARNRP